MKTESTVRPQPLKIYTGLIRINYDVSEEEREDMDGNKMTFYVYRAIDIDKSNVSRLAYSDYPMLVSAIIRDRYSVDDVEAITQNYLADESAEHVREFNTLQDWRALAKSEAKNIIEYSQNME